MTRENGRCPVSGRVDMDHISEKDDPTKVDSLELAHIISQSISKGIRGGSEEARQKVRTLPVPRSTLKLFPLSEV